MEKKKRIKVILLVLAVGAVFVGAIIFAVTWNHASESSSNPVTPTEKIETSTEVGDFEEPIVPPILPPIVPNDANQKPSENSPDVEVDVEDYRPNLGPEVMDVEITYDTKEDTKNEEKNN